MGWKILLPQEIMDEGEQLLVDAGHTLIRGRGFETEDVLADMKEHRLDAMIVRIMPITREVIEANPNPKVAARHGAGFDAPDVKACHDNGVRTPYVPVANSISVVETTTLLMLKCSHNVIELKKTWVWDHYKAKLKTRKTTVSGRTVGIIGYENIGSRLVVRALDMEMSVLAYDPYKKTDEFPEGVEVMRDLDRVFKESDYASSYVPNTPITRGMVNKGRLEMVKLTTFLTNMARGGCVVEQDLYGACKNETTAGVGLDAIQGEPVDPVNPSLTLDDVTIYLYIGGNAMEAAHRASYFAAMGIQEVYEGKEPTWPINDIGYVTASTYTDMKKPSKKSFGMFDS